MDNSSDSAAARSYAPMAADQPREREAEEWSEALITDGCVPSQGKDLTRVRPFERM